MGTSFQTEKLVSVLRTPGYITLHALVEPLDSHVVVIAPLHESKASFQTS